MSNFEAAVFAVVTIIGAQLVLYLIYCAHIVFFVKLVLLRYEKVKTTQEKRKIRETYIYWCEIFLDHYTGLWVPTAMQLAASQTLAEQIQPEEQEQPDEAPK